MSKKKISYSFPATRFTRENTIEEQLTHVASECFELMYECDFDMEIDSKTNLPKTVVVDYNPKKTIEEAWDLYHSLESLFRMWEALGVDINKYRQDVEHKNRVRNYYLEGDCSNGNNNGD